MNFRKLDLLYTFAVFLVLVLVSSGCAKLMGSLRRDLDDSEPYSAPTVGGAWQERGFLDDDRYASVGHNERNPASSGFGGARGRDSWITPDHADSNRRDLYRGNGSDEAGDEESGNSYSNNPNTPPASVKRLYKNGNRATRADFVDESPNEGSLWASDGQTNYYFTKNKIRGVGDIITVNVEANLANDVMSEATRTLSPHERQMELLLAQERIRAKALGLSDPDGKKNGKDALASSAAAPARKPAGTGPAKEGEDAPDITVPEATPSDIDVSKSLEFKAGDTMLAEIVERYPNGNYKIRGSKKVRYRGASRLISMVGVVRGTDIGEDDTVNSGKLYEYRPEVLR